MKAAALITVGFLGAMGPAGRQAHRTAGAGWLDQPVVGGEAIDLHDAGIAGQVPRNTFPASAGRLRSSVPERTKK